jgi:prepilin-type N-terminal cleavage/methylation domain-containing protein
MPYGIYGRERYLLLSLMKSFTRLRRAAFTLAEVMVALGIFGITAAAAVSAMLRMNNNAALSRLQTGASTVAQNQIDLCLSDSPFNPQKSQVPPALTIGTTSTGSSSSPTVPVYTDPKSGMQVMGWMVTDVANTNTTLSGTNLNIYQITVTVNYKFKGRSYNVKMGTMRASDI